MTPSSRIIVTEGIHDRFVEALAARIRALKVGHALEAGIDDLGGIDIHDVINPAYPQPGPVRLKAVLEAEGWELRPRLCVHQGWLDCLPSGLRQVAEACTRRLLHSC